MTDSPIKIANELMTIDEACIEIGMGSVSGMAKTYCPFPLMHADGGRTRAFKVYPEDNTAYCFACMKKFDPVSLIAADRDIRYIEAAKIILDLKGWVPPDYESQWSALATRATPVDYDGLQEALKLACGRFSTDWERLQLEPTVARKLSECFALVHKVQNDDDARKWLDVTKEAMRRVLMTTVAASSPAR